MNLGAGRGDQGIAGRPARLVGVGVTSWVEPYWPFQVPRSPCCPALQLVGNFFAAFWRELTRDVARPYRPERHYMRGPGPAWRAKHGLPPHG